MLEIDFPTLIVSGVIGMAVIMPFAYYAIKSKKAKKAFFTSFDQYASGLNLSPELREDWRNRYILAFDKAKNILLYYQSGENEEKREISLKEVARVTVHQTFFNDDPALKNQKNLDQLALQVHFKDPSKKSLYLEIYNSENYSDLVGETVLAARWADLINKQLSK